MSTVMFVDDNVVNRQLLTRVLQLDGHDVITAADGREALDELGRHHVDVVVLDLMMPVMDGFAFLRALRADRAREQVPVVVYSAMSDEHSKSRAAALGAEAFVVKSRVGVEELLNLVRTHTRKA
jgi:adenylate cyclase